MRSVAVKCAVRLAAAMVFVSCASGPARESEPADVGATSEQFRRVIGSHLNQFESCYELAIDAYPGAAGKMVVRFMVDADGIVKDSEIKSTHPSLKAGEECVLARVRDLRFPSQSGREEIEIIYPFFFTENGRLPAQ